MLWMAPSSRVVWCKSSLAVLHNRNDMTNLFRASNWVSAQTRVGFLTDGRKKYFLALPEEEQMVQLIVEFPFPTAAATLIEARGFGLRPVSGSHFFARPSHGLGHKHPIRASTPNPPPPLPLTIQRWPPSSSATSSPDLPEYEFPPPQHFCRLVPNNFTNRALTIYTPKTVSITPTLNPKIGSPPTALQ